MELVGVFLPVPALAEADWQVPECRTKAPDARATHSFLKVSVFGLCIQ